MLAARFPHAILGTAGTGVAVSRATGHPPKMRGVMAHPEFEMLRGVRALQYWMLENTASFFPLGEDGNRDVLENAVSPEWMAALGAVAAHYGFRLSDELSGYLERIAPSSFIKFVPWFARALRSMRNNYDELPAVCRDFPSHAPHGMPVECLAAVGGLRVLGLGHDLKKCALLHLKKILCTPQRLDEKGAAFVRRCCEAFEMTALCRCLPEKFLIRRNLAHFLNALWEAGHNPCASDFCSYLNSPWEILCLIAIWSDHLPSFPTKNIGLHDGRRVDTRFFKVKRLSRKKRRFILACLDAMPGERAIVSMKKDRDLWVHIAQTALHPSEYAKKYPNAEFLFFVLRKKTKTGARAPKIQTFQTKLQTAFDMKNVENILKLLSVDPMLFAQNIDRTLRMIWNDIECKEYETLYENPAVAHVRRCIKNILKLTGISAGERPLLCMKCHMTLERIFLNHVDAIPSTALIKLYHHFELEKNPKKYRIFAPKKTRGKIYEVLERRRPLPEMALQGIRNVILEALLKRFQTMQKFTNSIVDSALEDIPVLWKKSENMRLKFQALRSGRMPIGETIHNFVRMFFYRRAKPDGFDGDVDFVALCCDTHGRVAGVCANRMDLDASGCWAARHGGHIRNAPWPDGCCEWIDLNLRRLFEKKIRYIVPMIVCGSPIYCDQLESVFSGVQTYPTPVSAQDLPAPETSVAKLALTGPLMCRIPYILDLKNYRLVVADMRLNDVGIGNLRDLEDSPQMMRTIRCAYEKTTPSCRMPAVMLAAARADVVWVRLASADEKTPQYLKFVKKNIETPVCFYERIVQRKFDEKTSSLERFKRPVLAFLRDDNVEFPENSEVYAARNHRKGCGFEDLKI